MHKQILLLNDGNYEHALVYPYAFVQITAIARKYGIQVIRVDLYEKEYSEILPALLKDQFDFIFISMRNNDTLGLLEYYEGDTYFPMIYLRDLVSWIRLQTAIPIVVGGFGFSVMPELLFSFIHPDFGVYGGADGLFMNYEKLLNEENLESIPNLLFMQGELKRGPVIYYPPLNDIEYTDELITEIKNFQDTYSDRPALVTSIAVDYSRGCPYSCVFCSEPLANGNMVRYREKEVLKKELRLLWGYELRSIFLVCSELKYISIDLICSVFEELKEEGLEFDWRATWIHNLNESEYQRLYSCGFTGGWVDMISLERINLNKINGPYTIEKETLGLDAYISFIKQKRQELSAPFLSIEDLIVKKKDEVPSILHNSWTMFLGNQFCDIGTLRETLRLADENGYSRFFRANSITRPTRMFPQNSFDSDYIFSINETYSRIPVNYVYPTFLYPPQLLKHFGSEAKVEELLSTISDVFLSYAHEYKKSYQQFLITNFSVEEGQQKFTRDISEYFAEESPELNVQARALLLSYVNLHKDVYQTVITRFGIDDYLKKSPFQICQLLYTHFDINQIRTLLEVKEERRMWNYLLFIKSIPIDSSYKELFIKYNTEYVVSRMSH
ncbi:MAG: hypothetical protein INQ03_24875 [Candidatus Heimdallarchaeota archaeon]|nr:hypothetical protein [Candidatus Heimdallarchaeota archaeon]